MSLEEFYYVSQIIASFAVLASLIYLSLQTRQTSRNQQSAMAQARTNGVLTQVQIMLQPDVRTSFRRGSLAADDLTADELVQFTSIFVVLMANAENSFLQHRSGSLSDAAFETPRLGLKRFMALKGPRACWRL